MPFDVWVLSPTALSMHDLSLWVDFYQDVHFFFFNDTATTEIYTLSLHDALPICIAACVLVHAKGVEHGLHGADEAHGRSEEHTSELQSHLNLVCRLLLEKKKRTTSFVRCWATLRRDTTAPPAPSPLRSSASPGHH